MRISHGVAEDSQSVQGRVLVVDDDPAFREATLRAFREHGYLVDGAGDGLQAMQRLQHGEYDVIITDLQMPRLDGLRLIREARRLGFHQPIVVQTTVLDGSLEIVLRRAGAFQVLTKGESFASLVRSVEEARHASAAAAATLLEKQKGSPNV